MRLIADSPQNATSGEIDFIFLLGSREIAMGVPAEIVFLLNGDSHTREKLRETIAASGLRVIAFQDAADFEAFQTTDVPGCLVLDTELPDRNGMDLQQQLAASSLPIVFVTHRADVACSVRAIKAGAIDFLTLPLREDELLQAIHLAFERGRVRLAKRARLADLQLRYSRLTPRERQVLRLTVSGLLNKQAAVELGIKEATIQIHRGKAMQKMAAPSFADLVRMAAELCVPLCAATRNASRLASQGFRIYQEGAMGGIDHLS
jgi:FixJ family two-component response regulator